jgi:glycosyltransferase involved in cell wall biosynthesis
MPFVFFWAKMCKCKIYLIAIGSWLPEYTKTYFGLSYLLKRFDKILVQSTQMVDALSKQNFQNVSYLFNFKEHNFERKDNFEKANRSELKIIFLSRVIWEKGLDVISFLAEQINTKKSPYLIDIYGPVDKQNSEEILQMIDSHECLEYRGIAPPETVHQIMSEYDVFLFPTRWHGEGFPGVILDAFIAGIPIIASDWRFNAELVTDDVGMIFKFGKEYEILSFLDRIYTNPDFLKKLKMNSYNKRDLYSDRTAEEILKTEGLIDD